MNVFITGGAGFIGSHLAERLLARGDRVSILDDLSTGGMAPIAHRDLVDMLVSTAGRGRCRLVEWPPEKKAIDIGDFYADSSLIRQTVGWEPVTPLPDGLARTLAYYRANMHHYVPTTASEVGAL